MRLAVIGNSHLAAIKLGWDLARADYPDIEPVFFGARGTGFDQLQVEGNCLVPSAEQLKDALRFTSGGREKIDFQEFDACVLVGLSWRLEKHPDLSFSKAVRIASARGIFERSLCNRVFGLVRAVSDVPVYILHQPLHRKRPKDPVTKGLPYALRISEVCTALAGIDAIVVGQHESTLVHDRFTGDAFGLGAVQLDVGEGASSKRQADFGHMNARYGVFALKMLADAMECPGRG